MIYPIVRQNFTTLFRAGAFNLCDGEIVPMSNYKWHKIEAVAKELDVMGYISAGAARYKHSPALPSFMMAESKVEKYDCSDGILFNRFKEKRYERICEAEHHDIAPSAETLHLLQLIIAIHDDVVTSQLPLNGIITLGRLLRDEGDKVDYIKLENWIKRLGIAQSASLQASMLIELFDFEKDEFPYINKFYTNAAKHYNDLIENVLDDKAEFSAISRMNIALIETASYHLGKFTSKITNVEE